MSGRQKPGEPAAKHVSPHLPLGKPLAGDLEVIGDRDRDGTVQKGHAEALG